MKNADHGLFSEVLGYGFYDHPVVPHERFDVVRQARVDRIPAVIAKVIKNQVEAIGQQRPERVVRIRGETVAVT